jgi:creatinine amidohydrolase
MSFYLHHKSWITISEELKTSDTVIIPLGSLEPHGPHKPVGCCFLLADVASKAIGERTGIPVTPVIPFGVSTPYKNFPGTMTVSMETLNRYVYEACQNLIINGFRKIIFFSAHGGENLSVLREISYRLREESGALCSVIHVWGVVQQLVPQNFWGSGLRIGHGGEPTTSIMLHLFPELVNMEKAELKPLRQPMEGFQTKSYGTHSFKDLPQSTSLFAEEVETSGFMGDPTRASSEKGRILYEKLIEYLVDYVEAFRKLDPALK